MDKYISSSALKYYFAVDTSYVGRKLLLLLWPFTHKVILINKKFDENFLKVFFFIKGLEYTISTKYSSCS